MSATKPYSVLVDGVAALDLSMALLRDLCDLFVEGAQRSARLLAEGRSVARGTAPAWASSVADIRISKYAPGSLDLGLQVGRLVDLAPEIFAQEPLFSSGVASGATAFDLFLDAADDAVAGRRESERLDAGVLDVLARAGALFTKGVTSLRVEGEGRTPVIVDASAARAFRLLSDELPPARVSRVRGTLDMLTVSTKTLVLRLDDGRLLRGFASAAAFEALKGFLGQDTVLEGSVSFRPSGDALRIEVDSAFLATPADLLWARLPRVDATSSRPRAAATPTTGLDAFFGSWPGDETDEQLAVALRTLS